MHSCSKNCSKEVGNSTSPPQINFQRKCHILISSRYLYCLSSKPYNSFKCKYAQKTVGLELYDSSQFLSSSDLRMLSSNLHKQLAKLAMLLPSMYWFKVRLINFTSFLSHKKSLYLTEIISLELEDQSFKFPALKSIFTKRPSCVKYDILEI